jgi:hypothetical protein
MGGHEESNGNSPNNFWCSAIENRPYSRRSTNEVSIDAIQVIRAMRGSSQSQLVLGSDGNLWVVKFQNNPEHVRVLANDMLGTRIAEMLGFSVPSCAVINVSSSLVESDPAVSLSGIGGVPVKITPGRHFGSRFVGGLMPGQVVDYLPEQFIGDVPNLDQIPGMLAFDKWTGNSDFRQAVYYRESSRRRYRAFFIDQGHCFNAGRWTFPDTPLSGTFYRKSIYTNVTGWNTFEPWLQRIENFPLERLWRIALDIPIEWYQGDLFALERLIERLFARRRRIRYLIEQFRTSDRMPFPLWVQERPKQIARKVVCEPLTAASTLTQGLRPLFSLLPSNQLANTSRAAELRFDLSNGARSGTAYDSIS